MGEQLELFGNDELPPARASEGKGRAEPAPPSHHARSSEPVEDLPEGYVWVTVGFDENLTKEAAEHARRLGLNQLADAVKVVWNKRMRTAAGRAFYQTGKIELNPKLQTLPADQRDTEIRQTFLHEMAHLVSFARNKGKKIQPHGIEWKTACADLGIPGEDRCHDLNFQPRRQKRNFAYICPVCDAEVLRVRRLTRKVACYDCCKAHSGGRYDSRFVLEERKLR
ncbi:MAG: SprT-like domain-containing protein [Verrucomicrobiales bacterium]|nr:SprT-like domain-containing protein [Verrucomicrobiales bacterium]